MWPQLRAWLSRVIAAIKPAVEAHPLASSGKASTPTAWSLEDQLCGYAVLRAGAFATWIHRRIETFEFPGEDTIRRRMSVDFTIPQGEFSTRPEQIMVPLMVLKKVDLKNFDIVDASGIRLQTLTARENGDIARRGFEFLFGNAGSKNPEALAAALASVVEEEEPERAMASAYKELSPGGYLDEALKELKVKPATERILRALIQELAVGFMLMVRRDYRPGSRDLIKFSYDARREHVMNLNFKSIRSEFSKAELGEIKSLYRTQPRSRVSLSRPYRRVMRILSGFGLVARQEDFEGLQLGWAQSYHVEVAPPVDMWSAETSLEPEGKSPMRIRDKSRPHLRVSGESRDSVGQLTVLLHPRPDALVVPLVLSAAVISATMAFIPSRAASLDKQTLTALLVLPSALAAYYVRSSEHRYVTSALRPLRLVAIVPVLAGLFVVGMLGLGFLDVKSMGAPRDPEAVQIALVLAKVAASLALLLLVAWLSPSVGTFLRERVTRNLERGTSNWPTLIRGFLASQLIFFGLLTYVGAFAGAIYGLCWVIGS